MTIKQYIENMLIMKVTFKKSADINSFVSNDYYMFSDKIEKIGTLKKDSESYVNVEIINRYDEKYNFLNVKVIIDSESQTPIFEDKDEDVLALNVVKIIEMSFDISEVKPYLCASSFIKRYDLKLIV